MLTQRSDNSGGRQYATQRTTWVELPHPDITEVPGARLPGWYCGPWRGWPKVRWVWLGNGAASTQGGVTAGRNQALWGFRGLGPRAGTAGNGEVGGCGVHGGEGRGVN